MTGHMEKRERSHISEKNQLRMREDAISRSTGMSFWFICFFFLLKRELKAFEAIGSSHPVFITVRLQVQRG